MAARKVKAEAPRHGVSKYSEAVDEALKIREERRVENPQTEWDEDGNPIVKCRSCGEHMISRNGIEMCVECRYQKATQP